MTIIRTYSASPGTTLARGLIAAVLGLLISAGAMAEKPTNITAGEIALLPKYCPDTMGFKYGDAYTNTSPRAGYWVGLMGKSFWHMHHYCWGLIKMRRATSGAVSAEVRLGLLRNIVGEMEYVIDNSTPDFVMLPDVYLRMGEAYLLLKQVGQAAEAFNESRRRRPDYPPPYLRWAELLATIGKKKEALAHLEIGLRHAPASPELRAQHTRLGGNTEAFLKTLPAPPAEPAQPAASAAPVPASAPSAAASS